MTYTYLIPELYACYNFSKVYMGKKNLQSDYVVFKEKHREESKTKTNAVIYNAKTRAKTFSLRDKTSSLKTKTLRVSRPDQDQD